MKTDNVYTGFMALILGLIGGLIWMAATAHAHDWFSGRTDPVTNVRCCGGSDCASIPAEWFDDGSIIETKDGFYFNLTAKQSLQINFEANYPVKEFIPWARIQMSSDDGTVQPKDPAHKSGFAVCIWGREIKCIFKPPGNAQRGIDARRQAS